MVIVAAVLVLAMAGYSSGTWCVCKEGLSDAMLQKTLDYACGAGADCGPILQNGPCFIPNTVKSHCSYAVNSYFHKKSQSPASCDFAGTTSISASDPSYSGCPFPASASTVGTTNPVTTSPSTRVPTTTNTSPYSATPSTGIFGGAGDGGMGPSGPGGINPDYTYPSFGSRLKNPFPNSCRLLTFCLLGSLRL